jgi:hypothetical protein
LPLGILDFVSDIDGEARYLLGVDYLGRLDGSDSFFYFLYNGHGDVAQTVAENGYVENQYYDPGTARFLNEDTYTGDPNDPLSLNLYT